VTADDFTNLPGYISVLGSNAAGRELLRLMKTSATLPMIHRHADVKKLDMQGVHLYQLECRATDLQALAMQQPQPCGLEERRKEVIL
jgi:hypothetical protein